MYRQYSGESNLLQRLYQRGSRDLISRCSHLLCDGPNTAGWVMADCAGVAGYAYNPLDNQLCRQ